MTLRLHFLMATSKL